MITIYHDTDGWLVAADEWQPGSWIHVEAPDEAELELLHRRAGVPLSFLHAALDPREVARTDSRQGVHLVIARAPVVRPDSPVAPFQTMPLAMIVAPDTFITLSHSPIDFVRDLNFEQRESEVVTRRAGRMILVILAVIAEWYLHHLDEVEELLQAVENNLKDSIENSEMLELLRYEKSLVNMKTGLEWNYQMVEHLQQREHFEWQPDDQDLLADVLIEYRQGFHVADTMLTMLESTTDAFASLISNNLNVVMKFLASVTIVLTIPTLVASIYGMNIPLPGANHPFIMGFILVGAFALTLLVAWWFYRRGWLSFRWRK